MTQKIIDANMVVLSIFGAQSQANRLMRMDFPQADGLANTVMLVNKVHMREELSNLRDDETLAQRRMEEHDQRTQYFEAGGNDGAAQPDRTFKLNGHFSAEVKAPAPG